MVSGAVWAIVSLPMWAMGAFFAFITFGQVRTLLSKARSGGFLTETAQSFLAYGFATFVCWYIAARCLIP